MLWSVSSLREFDVYAGNARCGRITDALIDDRTWRIRWFVVEVGTWMHPHKVLVPPSAFTKPDEGSQRFPTSWSIDGVVHGRDVADDPPVAMQMTSRAVAFAADGLESFPAIALSMDPNIFPILQRIGDDGPARGRMDPHLRSFVEIAGYGVAESNGALGKLHDFIVDDDGWRLTHLLIRWSHWWTAHDVLMSVKAVRDVRWDDKTIVLDALTDEVRHAPPLASIAVHGSGVHPRPSSGWESVM